MKRIIFLLSIVFLSINLSIAQKTISKKDLLSKYNITEDNSHNTMPDSEAVIAKIQTVQTSTPKEIQSKPDQLQEQDDLLRDENAIIEYQKSFETFKSIVYGLFGLLAILIAVAFFLIKKKSREYVIDQVLGSKRITEKFHPDASKSYTLSERDLDTIVDRVLECTMLNAKEIRHQNTKIKETVEPSKTVTKYLKGKSGKTFNRTENTPDNSFFKLFNEKDETALFDFYGDEAEALAKRIFSEDICIIVSGSYQTAHSIKTSKPGKVRRVGEQWEVIEPIQIKLI